MDREGLSPQEAGSVLGFLTADSATNSRADLAGLVRGPQRPERAGCPWTWQAPGHSTQSHSPAVVSWDQQAPFGAQPF